MIFMEYEILKRQYIEIQDIMSEILTEQEDLFKMTQPKAVKYDVEGIKNSTQTNTFENYLVAKDKRQIDARLQEAKKILTEREFLLRQKAKEVQQSKEVIDQVYYYRYIKGVRAEKIAYKLSYSISQIYRYINMIKDAKECEKKCDILIS